jgi:hypothetical protein
MSLQVCLT